MKRIVFIWLKRWPLNSARLPSQAAQPFGLNVAGSHGLRLAAVSPAAEAAGITVGMSLADARAICPDLKSQPLEPEKSLKALRQLARWAGRYTPWVNVHHIAPSATGEGAEYGLQLDITGCAHLFAHSRGEDGEPAMLLDISERLEASGIEHAIGLGDTLGAAIAVARFAGPIHIIPHDPHGDETRRALSSLPVDSLRLDAKTCQTLCRLGLNSVGALLRLPRVALARRFPVSKDGRDMGGQDMGGAVLRRLDQAFGRIREPIEPIMPVPPLRARMNFAEPVVETDALVLALDGLVADLCRGLGRMNKKMRRMSLWLYRADGAVHRISAGIVAASRDEAHLLRLLSERVKQIDIQENSGDFGIELLILSADRVEEDTASQPTLVQAPASIDFDKEIARLMDRLKGRFHASAGDDYGAGRTPHSLTPQASHRPERAQLSLPVRTCAANDRWGASPGADRQTPIRPFRLLPRPERVQIPDNISADDQRGDGPPLRFLWRHQNVVIRRAEGPERISPEWWPDAQDDARRMDQEGGPSSRDLRDYYRLEAENGQRFWLYYSTPPKDEADVWPPKSNWYLHGIFA